MKKDPADEKKLNKDQKQAVEYNTGPLLIIAGAGTGKTHTLVEKITFIIRNNLAKPENILALTFTEKAAAEMEERVDRAVPYGYFQMWISTFHSFAERILKDEAAHIGLPYNLRLLTQAESILFLKSNLFLLDLHYFRPLGNPHKFLDALNQHFSRLQDEDVMPEQYKHWAQKLRNHPTLITEEIEKYQELSNAYTTYQKIKLKEGVMDFSDLVFYALQLFKKRPSILKKYQDQFPYVLVDEFQDTNIGQYSLIKLLCPPVKNSKLTVVGDDSQAIYKFRGASISNILMFMKEYPDAKQVTLRKNYRSNQRILDAAHALIKHNDPDTLEARLGISKNLIAEKTDNIHALEYFYAKNIEEEADYVVNRILSLKKERKEDPPYTYSDFAVLVRANNHSNPFIHSLVRHGIPYQFLGPSMLFKQPEVKDLIAYLKVLYDLEDTVSFYRVLTMLIFSLDQKDVSLLLSFSKKIHRPLFLTVEIYLSFFEKEIYKKEFEIYKPHLPFISEETQVKLSSIYRMINRHLSLIKKESGGQILYYFLEDTKYLQSLISYKTEKEERKALNISKFFIRLRTFEDTHEDPSLFAIVDYIEMCMEVGDSPWAVDDDRTTYDAVNILTVHGAKGLEFPVVFIVNLSQGRFPTYSKKEILPIPQELIKEILPEGDYHIQEERRLFYVAMTRAMNTVVLTSSQFYGEGKRERRISTFVPESLGPSLLKKLQNIKKEEKNQLSIFDFKKSEEPPVKQTYQPNTYSFSQLESYELCPLQYKYQYVLRIPTTPSSAASFGDTIHRTLQAFYQEFLKDTRVGKNRLIELYYNLWSPIGYASYTHEQRMKKEGEHMLTSFFQTFHTKKLQILALEKFFKIRIHKNLYLSGKIDRVDKKRGKVIEIIDYKTGKKPQDKFLKKSLQLSIYALAATNQALFGKKPDEVHLTFYYLQDREKVSIQRSVKEITDVIDQVTADIKKIRTSEFSPSVGPWCGFCPYRMICEAW